MVVVSVEWCRRDQFNVLDHPWTMIDYHAMFYSFRYSTDNTRSHSLFFPSSFNYWIKAAMKRRWKARKTTNRMHLWIFNWKTLFKCVGWCSMMGWLLLEALQSHSHSHSWFDWVFFCSDRSENLLQRKLDTLTTQSIPFVFLLLLFFCFKNFFAIFVQLVALESLTTPLKMELQSKCQLQPNSTCVKLIAMEKNYRLMQRRS